MLALVGLAYSGLGTIISLKVSRPLIPINFAQQRYEADFRFGLVHVRDNAESIAMYGGEQQEAKQLVDRFAVAVSEFQSSYFVAASPGVRHLDLQQRDYTVAVSGAGRRILRAQGADGAIFSGGDRVRHHPGFALDCR